MPCKSALKIPSSNLVSTIQTTNSLNNSLSSTNVKSVMAKLKQQVPPTPNASSSLTLTSTSTSTTTATSVQSQQKVKTVRNILPKMQQQRNLTSTKPIESMNVNTTMQHQSSTEQRKGVQATTSPRVPQRPVPTSAASPMGATLNSSVKVTKQQQQRQQHQEIDSATNKEAKIVLPTAAKSALTKTTVRRRVTNKDPTSATTSQQLIVVTNSYINDNEECILPDQPNTSAEANRIKSETVDDEFIGGD